MVSRCLVIAGFSLRLICVDTRSSQVKKGNAHGQGDRRVQVLGFPARPDPWCFREGISRFSELVRRTMPISIFFLSKPTWSLQQGILDVLVARKAAVDGHSIAADPCTGNGAHPECSEVLASSPCRRAPAGAVHPGIGFHAKRRRGSSWWTRPSSPVSFSSGSCPNHESAVIQMT